MDRIRLLFLCVLMLIAAPILAQQYGTGTKVNVPYVAPGTLKMDGNADEAAWATAASVNMTANWDGAWSNPPHPTADVITQTKLLWTRDTLYVYAKIQDYEKFYWGKAGEPWGGEQILIGVDGTHDGDNQMDESWSGWPWNAPGKGPTTYKVWKNGVTFNWGGYKVVRRPGDTISLSPTDTGWVKAKIFVDSVTYKWGVEMAIYVPQVRNTKEIGFNIGGASASKAYADSNGGDGAHAYFSWQSSMYPGGDVMHTGPSFGTLVMTGGPAYGTGASVNVPYVAPGTVKMDGNADEAAWATAASVNMTANWDGAWSNPPHPTADVITQTKLLWTRDTLYVYAKIQDYEKFYWGKAGEPWGGEQILIGIDGTHEGDNQMDESWSGWPWNAPGKGPTTYKLWKNGVTFNWGGYKVVRRPGDTISLSPTDTGWVKAKIFVDSVGFKWGAEMAIYVPQIGTNGKIGFNIGGASASKAYADSNGGDGAHAYFSWQSSMYPGGDVMHTGPSFGSLVMTGGPAYGAGASVDVPYVAAGTLKLDGNADEAAWVSAASVNMTANWDGAWSKPPHPTADVITQTKLLWTRDTLYVYAKIQDYEKFYWGKPGEPWGGEQILIGVDGTHDGDNQMDESWSGWPWNAPGKGPTTYKLWKNGVTFNWGGYKVVRRPGDTISLSPTDTGWVKGKIFVDSVGFKWGAELAIYVPQARLGSALGFNIGGASASKAYADSNGGDGAHAYFSWKSTMYPGGDVMHTGPSFGTLSLVTKVTAVEKDPSVTVPEVFALEQNYPNPFNPSTKISYQLPEAARVTLTIFNVLGQKVADLVDDHQVAGRYVVDWNARSVSTGVYFYQLKADNRISVKKMLLLK